MTPQRGVDLLFVSYHRVIRVSVPVCRACKRKRTVVGVASFLGVILFIFAGVLVCAEFSTRHWGMATGVVAAVVVLVVLLARLGLTDLVDWRMVGMHIVWRSGDGVPLEVRFRDREYFRDWLVVNPKAIVEEP
jgi:hypothetical protein